MLGRRTVSTVILLLVAAGTAYSCIAWDTTTPLLLLSIIVLALSFSESVSFIPGRYTAKVLLFGACAASFAAITLLSPSSDPASGMGIIAVPPLAQLAFAGALMLFFACNAMFWRKVDYRTSAAETGWAYVSFVYYGVLIAIGMRILLHPDFVVWDRGRGPLGSPDSATAAGVYFFLASVLTAKFTDIGAYLGGSLTGKHLFGGKKMAPRISPGKTMAGLLFGMLTALVAGSAALWYNPFGRFDPMVVFAFGPVVGLLTVGGDLMESLFKRSFKLKDSGSTLPGIGGVFDLTDSLFWACPGAYAMLILNRELLV